MKKVFMLIFEIILLGCTSCCSNSDKQDFYGIYTFEKVSYLSPLSSSTIDYLNKKMAGTKYTIEANLFKIESADYPIEISSPKYVKEEILGNISPLSGLHTATDLYTVIGDKVKYQYAVYDKHGNETEWRLLVSSDCLWIASGSQVLKIFKLSK